LYIGFKAKDVNNSDLKYLAAYIIPLTGFIAIAYDGVYSFIPIILSFIILPITELILPTISTNLSHEEETQKLSQKFFSYLLYLNLPLVFTLLGLYLIRMPEVLLVSDMIGKTMSIGLILASSGINVAHELGHKQSSFDRIVAKSLLLPSHYMHFIIEHNLGHHLNVSTPEDPATSRKNELLYTFWVRSTVLSYISAWKIETNVLRKKGLGFWTPQNRMLQFTFLQLSYLTIVFLLLGAMALYAAIIVGIFSFLVLETINYIEHYGLVRKKKANGKYERVTSIHSWNSDHQLGRIILYELTRHSDHHFKANKKYQILQSHKESPQLPLGYPGSLLCSLIPPLWFKLMNPRVDEWNRRTANI